MNPSLHYAEMLERVELEKENERLREALGELLAAAQPYLDNAAPHEQLFSGQDLRNFEALSAAVRTGAEIS